MAWLPKWHKNRNSVPPKALNAGLGIYYLGWGFMPYSHKNLERYLPVNPRAVRQARWPSFQRPFDIALKQKHILQGERPNERPLNES